MRASSASSNGGTDDVGGAEVRDGARRASESETACGAGARIGCAETVVAAGLGCALTGTWTLSFPIATGSSDDDYLRVGSLREVLVDRDSSDLVAILDGPQPDADLAAMWDQVVGRRDPVEILGNAVLWCPQPMLAGAVAECVRLVIDRAPRGARARLVATLDLLARHARGEASLEDVWDERSAIADLVEDSPSTAVLQAAEAAGDRTRGIDDEALSSAGEAVTRVIAIAGEPVRDAVIAILVRRFGVPTVAALEAAHAARA